MLYCRWHLSLSHLVPLVEGKDGLEGLVLEWGDIFDAKSFDPFTHVYMFDIGMPDPIFDHMSAMFNASQSAWLVSYQPPRRIVGRHGFDVELVFKVPVTMHGSTEGHTGYFYKRGAGTARGTSRKKLDMSGEKKTPCDPLFKTAWDRAKGGSEEVSGSELRSHEPRRRFLHTYFTAPMITFVTSLFPSPVPFLMQSTPSLI